MPLPTAERLSFAELARADAPFILELLTDADFLRYIGDRGVTDLESAARYIEAGPVASYRAHGFGLLAVRDREGAPIGMCGLLRRPTLDDVDVGFAFLPAHRGCGYAAEATRAVLGHARSQLGIGRVVAIVQPDNHRSIRTLTSAGLVFERRLRLAPADPELLLYATTPG
jgi:RimJ/RimL family protein N-acetyltransferase